MDVYKYMKMEDAKRLEKYGMKLSADYDQKIMMGDMPRLFFSAFLCPNAAYAAATDEQTVCVRIEVELEDCYIADKSRSHFCKGESSIPGKDWYQDSFVEAGKYSIGTYRTPECLVGYSIAANHVHIEAPPIEAMGIVGNAQSAYIKSSMEKLVETQEQANEMLLYCYFEKMVERGKYQKWESNDTHELLYRGEDGTYYILANMEDHI